MWLGEIFFGSIFPQDIEELREALKKAGYTLKDPPGGEESYDLYKGDPE